MLGNFRMCLSTHKLQASCQFDLDRAVKAHPSVPCMLVWAACCIACEVLHCLWQDMYGLSTLMCLPASTCHAVIASSEHAGTTTEGPANATRPSGCSGGRHFPAKQQQHRFG